MNEQAITRLVKQGFSDRYIRSLAANEYKRTIGSFHRGRARRIIAAPEQKEPITRALIRAGFRSEKGWQPSRADDVGDTELNEAHYLARKGGIHLEARWSGNLPSFFFLELTMPDGSHWGLDQEAPLITLCSRLSHFLKSWERYQQEQQNIDLMLSKVHKKLEIGLSSVTAFLNYVAQNSSLTYGIERKGQDTLLHIRLKQRRSLTIRLTPNMDMTLLADLLRKIQSAADVIDSFGSLPISVKNYSKPKHFWQQAGKSRQNDNDMQP